MADGSRSSELGKREGLDVLTAIPGDIPLHDQRELMERPFFSLAKRKRVDPIEYKFGDVWVHVEASPSRGMATIWDADILLWAGSQLVEAHAKGLKTSPLLRAPPYQMLRFMGRGTRPDDYERLFAALGRLQGTNVTTNIRQGERRHAHQFSWISEWERCVGRDGTHYGVDLVVPNWFYAGVLDRALILTVDRDYFQLTGGIERWLYRVVRKHAGWQQAGWQFSFRKLHQKSGSAARFSDFALDIRRLASRQALPGYWLDLLRRADGEEVLHFTHRSLLAPDHPGFEFRTSFLKHTAIELPPR
jgi:plasmid replication initiation protein